MADPVSPAEALALGWLVKEWASRLALSLESMTGSAPAVTAGDPSGTSPIDAADGALLWRQSFEPLQDAAIWVGAEQSVWSNIGRTVLSAAGVEDASGGDLRGTYLGCASGALRYGPGFCGPHALRCPLRRRLRGDRGPWDWLHPGAGADGGRQSASSFVIAFSAGIVS